MYCKNCGKEIQINQRFCTLCGVEAIPDPDTPSIPSFETYIEELRAIRFSLGRIDQYTESDDKLALSISEDLKLQEQEVILGLNHSLDSIGSGETPGRLNYLRQVIESSDKLGDRSEDLVRRLDIVQEVQSPVASGTFRPPGGRFLTSFFSGNLLAALLALGVLLVVASSLVLLVTLWDDSPWFLKQLFLLVQMLAFVAVGHLVKERMCLLYSGLALITVGALWALLNSGTFVYEFVVPDGNFKVPGLGLPLDLPPYGWLIIFSPTAVIWGILAVRYKGHVLTNGCALFFICSSGMIFPSIGLGWNWGLASASLASAVVTYLSSRLDNLGMEEPGRYLFWSSQVVLLILFFVAVQVWGEDRQSLYPMAIICASGSLMSCGVLLNRGTDGYSIYAYNVLILLGVAITVAVLEWGIIPDNWFGLVPVSLSIMYSIGSLWYLGRIRQISIYLLLGEEEVWAEALMVSAVSAAIFGCLWPDFYQLSKSTTLDFSALPLWIVLRKAKYWEFTSIAGVLLASGGLLFLDLGADLWEWTLIFGAWLAFGVSLLSGAFTFGIVRFSKRDAMPFLGISVLLSVASVIMAGWDDWANWEGLVMAATFGLMTLAIGHRYSNRVVATASVFWFSVAGGFGMGMVGFYKGERAIGWAVESLILLWTSVLVGKSKVVSREGKNLLWTNVLRFSSMRLSWFALAYVALAAVLGLFKPDILGEPELTVGAVTFSLVGLSYVGVSLLERKPGFGYGGVCLLLIGWILQAADWELGQAQFYAIPAGIYLLGVGYVERRRNVQKSSEMGGYYSQQSEVDRGIPISPLLEAMAVLVMGVSVLIQSITQEPEWVYAVLMGVEGVGMIVWGSAIRSRVLLIGGLLLFFVDVIYQITSLLSSFGGAIVGVVLGIILLVVVIMVERFRERIVRVSSRWFQT